MTSNPKSYKICTQILSLEIHLHSQLYQTTCKKQPKLVLKSQKQKSYPNQAANPQRNPKSNQIFVMK